MKKEVTLPTHNYNDSYSLGYKRGVRSCVDGKLFTDEELRAIIYGIYTLIHDNEEILKSMKDQYFSKEIESRNTSLSALKHKISALIGLNDE